MKTAVKTKKQPSKKPAAASRKATPVQRTQKPKPEVRPEPTRTAPVNPTAGSAVPDLTTVGVDPHAAGAHVAQCEECARAHRHVLKNPKDAMALESFARRISVCLAREAKASA